MKTRWIAALTALLLLSGLLPSCAGFGKDELVMRYPASDDVLVNPFAGSAVWALDLSQRTVPFTLVYVNITWRELEPEEGRFDFAGIEEKYHFDHWRAAGKHLILRFGADFPSSVPHCDLPDWLAERIGGGPYDIPYGKGWCPDYTDETFLTAHRAAVTALGERYNADPFVAFVELGSLGHWGEWHVHRDAGSMPDNGIKSRVVRDYREAFPDTFRLMRRPFLAAREYGCGLYNDMTGAVEDTLEWLDWIANGDGPEDEEGLVVPMPDAWKTVPVGGELTSGIPVADQLTVGENRRNLIRMLRLSHASWIGPHSFADLKGEVPKDELSQVLRNLGYRLRADECRISGKEITLTLVNDGTAPFYFPWPVLLRLTGAEGSETILKADLDIRTVLPGSPVSVSVPIPREAAGWTRIETGIADPVTGEPAVRLAMETEVRNGWHLLVSRAE